MGKKVLIVGGVAGGASAAARLRRLDEDAEIIMFERDEYISFANCGLPYYIGETIKERNKLLVQTPQNMNSRFNIDVRINSEVIAVDSVNKEVTVKCKSGEIYKESYDYLILSPGAKAIKPNIPGIDSSRIFTLRNIPDTDAIKALVGNKLTKKAVVIGGGYVGVEMAENLRERGLDVDLVEAAPHILAPFDSDMVTFAEKELEDNGIKLFLRDGVKAFEETSNGVQITLNSDTTLNADIVILAIGVAPDTAFLKESGIQLGLKGHIIVNDRMQTNIENIYAVGDAVEVMDFINKQNTAIPLAGPANKQGRIAADNVAGYNTSYKGTQGTSVIKIFSITGAGTGNNERTLQKLNIPYKVIYIHPQSHASYYPGATPISLKLIFDSTGKILGAQAFGYSGVEKRIDDIATVIRFGGTVTDLTELELSYAPPYSSAKDPVNMAGYVAENVITGKSEVIRPKDLENYDKSRVMLVDVRSPLEFENGNIKESINLPLDSLRNALDELDKSKEIWVYCQIGLRGYIAERILRQQGFNVKNLTGGYKTYTMANYAPNKNNLDSKSDAAIDPETQVVREDEVAMDSKNPTRNLDACGLCCPGPLMQVKMCMEDMESDEVLKVTASDPGFYVDIQSWCKRTNNKLLAITKDAGIITALIKKGEENEASAVSTVEAKDNKTLVVFSGDLDKAIASFIIANGAASMGRKVTMFFTFWGLNILRKHEKVDAKKSFMDKMFGMMMPRGSKKLTLSKMNMMGMGGKMIRQVMKNKNISSLEELIQAAIDNGVEIVACQMSMDVMGITHEELIDGVKIGGVGYYLGEAEDSNVNLFI